MYTYRWVSLMVWLYFTEGVVRAWSDTQPMGRVLAGIEIVLCLLLFVACAWHVRTRLRPRRCLACRPGIDRTMTQELLAHCAASSATPMS